MVNNLCKDTIEIAATTIKYAVLRNIAELSTSQAPSLLLNY